MKIHHISKKQRGIALIFSLFFLVIFFALGTFLLFRTSLHKKTANAIAESSIQQNQTEGAISAVRTNISILNMNNGVFGTSPVFEGKMDKVTLESATDSSMTTNAYTVHSSSTSSSNDDNSNLTGDLSTAELFKFTFNGKEIDGINTSIAGAPSPKWVINYADPSKSPSSSAMRYSYLILDQTGKVNPNFANSANLKGASKREGFDTEIYREAQAVDSTQTAAIFDLSSLFYSAYNSANNTADANNPALAFAATRINNVSELEGLINGTTNSAPVYPFNQASFSSSNSTGIYDGSAFIEKSSKELALELLYPYSQPVTYAEKDDIFNLAHITSDTFRALDDASKISTLLNNIPYLKNMASEAYLDYSPGASDSDEEIATNLKSLESDRSKKAIPTSQPEFIAASLIDMVDHDPLTTSNYGFYSASEPDETRTSDGVSKTFELAGKPWSFERWMRETGGKPYSGFEGLYVGQTTYQFRSYNRDQDITQQNTSTSSRDRCWIIVAPEVYCAYDLQGKTLSSMLKGVKDSKGNDLTGKNFLFYTRVRVTYNAAKITGKDTDGKYIYDTDARNFDEIIEVIAPLPPITEMGNFDYTSLKTAKRKLWYANYAPGTPFELMGINGQSTRTLGGNRVDSMQNWSNVLHSSDNDHDPDNLIGSVPAITWFEDNLGPDGTPVKPYINSVKITPESPNLIFLDIDGDTTPDPGEIVSIASSQFPDQGDDWVQDDKKGYSHHMVTTTDWGNVTSGNGSPQGDQYSIPEDYRTFVQDNGARAPCIMTVITAGDPRLSYLPSSSPSLKIDTDGNDLGGWMLDSYNISQNATGTGEYKNNDLSDAHLITDHFGNYYYDATQFGDINLRYPAIDEVKFTFPKFDNEVILPGTSGAWNNLAVQEGLGSFTYTVDSSENPNTELDTFISAAQDLNNYYPNRTVRPNAQKPDIPGIKSLSSFSLPLRDEDNNGVPDGFGDIRLAADIGKICRGEPWRTLNISQYNVSLLNDPTNSSLYSYAGVKDPYESDTGDSSSTDGHNYNKDVEHPILGTVKMIYPFNRIGLDNSAVADGDAEVDDLITDYSVDASNSGQAGTLLNGGDAAIMDQVGFDDGNNDFDGDGLVGVNDPTISLPKKTIYGAWNPNTAYPLALQTVISGVKINRYELASQTYLKGKITNDKNPALPQWKTAALTSNFYQLIQDNLNGSSQKAPFDRKYSYSTDISKSPGQSGYTEGFNVTSEFDNKSKTYMNGSQRVGTFRWGNVFANKKNYFLSDVEREMLYTNTKEFVSIRYNYYSTIVLVESLKILPASAGTPGENSVVNLESGVRAKVNSHFRVRAELAHDIITNEVKVIDYQILN